MMLILRRQPTADVEKAVAGSHEGRPQGHVDAGGAGDVGVDEPGGARGFAPICSGLPCSSRSADDCWSCVDVD